MSIAEQFYNHAHTSNADVDLSRKLLEIGQCLDQCGYLEDEECIQVVIAGLKFLGLNYGRHREIHKTEIDCGTLTSQSHWVGGMIGVPFIAENQKTAYAATRVFDSTEILPGDVAVRYNSLPAKEAHNHVGLIIGRYHDGRWAVLEAASRHGVQITALDDFRPQGGIKRFCLHPRERFSLEKLKGLQNAALLTPKTGRLGSALEECPIDGARHLGFDLEYAIGTIVLAPCSGLIEYRQVPFFGMPMVEIKAEDSNMFWRLGNIYCDFPNGTRVQEGDSIGSIAINSERWIYHSSVKNHSLSESTSHLHVEYGSIDPATLPAKLGFRHKEIFNGEVFVNGFYALKTKGCNLTR